jgi:hypothetical protein
LAPRSADIEATPSVRRASVASPVVCRIDARKGLLADVIWQFAARADRGPQRKGHGDHHAAANLAVLRRWLVSLLRRDRTITSGIEKKRLQAAWDEKILEGILGLS